MRSFIACLLTLATVLLCLSAPIHAKERILAFHSDIRIATDGSLTVTERIRVVAEGQAIRHGIYRDFSTYYREGQGNRHPVSFEVLSVLRDGTPIPWHTERLANSDSVRVYMADMDELITAGVHTFTFRYRTTRQLVFSNNRAVLHWNVTGTGWAFPIVKASAAVHLPEGVPASALEASGYINGQGFRTHNLTIRLLDDGAYFATTSPLGLHRNLSIVLEFPKDIIEKTALGQGFIGPSQGIGLLQNWLLWKSTDLQSAFLGLLVLWLYYVLVWIRHGRDPSGGPVMARSEPPGGDSAGALRYMYRMGYDHICLAAGVVDRAAQGLLIIERDRRYGEDDYRLVKIADPTATDLQPDNRSLLSALFLQSPTLKLDHLNRERLLKAHEAQRKALSRAYEKKYFLTNSATLVPGVLISAVALIGMLWTGPRALCLHTAGTGADSDQHRFLLLDEGAHPAWR